MVRQSDELSNIFSLHPNPYPLHPAFKDRFSGLLKVGEGVRSAKKLKIAKDNLL